MHFDDRSTTVGASEIAQCALRTYRQKREGREGWDEDYLEPIGASMRGNLMEDGYSVPVLRRSLPVATGLVWAEQGNQMRLMAPSLHMSATPDGLVTYAPDDFFKQHGIPTLGNPGADHLVLAEFKSVDPRKDKSKFPDEKHIAQLNMQLGLLRLHATNERHEAARENSTSIFDVHEHPSWGFVMYTDASFYDDVLIFPWKFQQMMFDQQVRRAGAIMTATSTSQIRPEGAVSGGAECRYCPFKGSCEGYAQFVPEHKRKFDSLTQREQNKITSYVGIIENTRRQIDPLTKRKAEAEANLKEALMVNKTKYAEGTLRDGRPFKVSWAKTGGAKTRRWDDDLLIEHLLTHGEDPMDFKTERSEGERMTVTVKGEIHNLAKIRGPSPKDIEKQKEEEKEKEST